MKRINFFQFILLFVFCSVLTGFPLKSYENVVTKSPVKKFYLTDESLTFKNDLFKPMSPAIDLDFTYAAEKTIHSVVNIRTEYQRKSSVYDDFFGSFDPFRDFFGGNQGAYGKSQQPIMATGSGVIISPDGYIITNNHVVQEADYIEVTLNNKESFAATLVGADPSTDLALLKIQSVDLPYITFGNSDSIRIGEWVLAVGNPFNLNSTVTAGIVSAKARNINILGRKDAIESFIQTDAAVNSGNSGGALVNTKGELIGINAAIASNTGSYAGYSFAIPVNIVRKVSKDILEYGQVQRAYIGLEISEMTSKLAEQKNIQKIPGVYVSRVIENGAAADAGIKTGDIIIELEDKMVTSPAELLEIIATKAPGDIVKATLVKDGKQSEAEVKLKNKYNNFDILKKEKESIINLLGATFENISADEAQELGIKNGVKVISIESGKLRSYGVRQGFIITYIDKTPVKNTDELYNIIKNKNGGILIEGIYPNGMRAYYGFGL